MYHEHKGKADVAAEIAADLLFKWSRKQVLRFLRKIGLGGKARGKKRGGNFASTVSMGIGWGLMAVESGGV